MSKCNTCYNKLKKNSKKTTQSLKRTLKGGDSKLCSSGWSKMEQSSTRWRLGITLPITEVFMPLEISRREKLFFTFLAKKSLLWKWQSLLPLANLCMRETSDKGWFLQSIRSSPLTLCRREGRSSLTSLSTSIYCPKSSTISLFFTRKKRDSGSRDLHSRTSLLRKSKTFKLITV